MSKLDNLIKKIQDERIGNSNKRVLVVEGVDDCDALSVFLNKKFPSWERNWVLYPAGNKKQVLAVIEQIDTWIGLIDKDEWTATEIAQHSARLPNLAVLPRFCLESYLVEPNELWAAFSPKQRDKFTGGVNQLSEEISATKESWLRHAALWHAINPLWGKLRGLGFKESVLDPKDVPNDDDLLNKLSSWHDTLDAQRTVQTINALISQFQQESDFQFYTQRLYAKDFFPLVVHATLNRFIGQEDEKTRRQNIFRHLPVPADLDVLWQKMELLK